MHELPKNQYEIISAMLDLWQSEGDIDGQTADRLRTTIAPAAFDRMKAARYLLAASLCCIFVGAAALTQSLWVEKVLKLLFGTSAVVRSVLCAIIAAALYATSAVRRKRYPEKFFTNEATLFLGVLATAASVALLTKVLPEGAAAALPGVAAVIYAAIAFAFDSVLVWTFALFALAGWLGAQTGYLSDWGSYWLGLNYPARFAIYGALLCLASTRMCKVRRAAPFERPTLCVGLLFLFVSLWIMSVFGNYGDLALWRAARRIELIHWSLIFAAAAGVSLWLGVKRDDVMLRGFGMVFLGINIYTRFFETFWNSMNKGLFFLILGASLWFIGSKIEVIRNFGKRDPVQDTVALKSKTKLRRRSSTRK